MKNIIFFGDSLTAGYGLSNSTSDSLPALIQAKVNSEQLLYSVVNAGLSGGTSAGGLSRVDTVLKQQVDVFVLELGANDMLRGIAPQHTAGNLQAIVNKVKVKYPHAKLMLLGMQLQAWVPGNFAFAFGSMFAEVAKNNRMAFLPFMLEGVAGIANLNIADGLHPNAAGYRIIASKVWPVMFPLL